MALLNITELLLDEQTEAINVSAPGKTYLSTTYNFVSLSESPRGCEEIQLNKFSYNTKRLRICSFGSPGWMKLIVPRINTAIPQSIFLPQDRVCRFIISDRRTLDSSVTFSCKTTADIGFVEEPIWIDEHRWNDLAIWVEL